MAGLKSITMKKSKACKRMIVAPLGTFKKYEAHNPTNAVRIPIEIDTIVILLNDLLINLDVAGGITRKAAIKTIPTTLIETTIVTAINILNK